MNLRGFVIAALGCAAIGSPLTPAANAATPAGTVDANFGYSTVAVGTWAGAAATAIQSDGSIVTAGEASVNGVDQILVTRMSSAGTVDSKFGTGGTVLVNVGGSSGVISGAGLAIQSDGKIVAAGTGLVNGSPNFTAVRLNANGTLDSTFGKSGIVTVPIGSSAMATAILVQPDGKLVLGGAAYSNGANHFAAVRLNASGSLDRTFGTNGIALLGLVGSAWGMVRQSNGSLVLAGQGTSTSSADKYLVARLTAKGTMDTTFGQGGVAAITVGAQAMGDAVALQSDGKIVVTGGADDGGSIIATARLTSSGSLDTTFGTRGISEFSGGGVNAVAIDSSGRILLAGVGAIVRLLPAGGMDSSFGTSGVQFLNDSMAVNGVALQPLDGKIVAAGAVSLSGRVQVAVARLWP